MKNKTKFYPSILFIVIFILISSNCLSQSVAVGESHCLKICSNGIVWATGANWSGQLGDGTTASSSIPVKVSSLSNITAVAAGGGQSLALKNDGTVWAWGENHDGELGIGTNDNSNVPVQVSSLKNVKAIACGRFHSYALKNDGTIWAWGKNLYGQLGDSTNKNSNIPVQVKSLTGMMALSNGGNGHSMALKNDGTIWAWGNNSSAQLGNGSKANSNFPRKVSSLTGIISLAAGYSSSVALKKDGTVWTWGSDNYGEIGNGSISDTFITVPVKLNLFGEIITAIASGENHVIALQNDSIYWAWGRNDYGQYGNNDGWGKAYPIQVKSLTKIKTLLAGGQESIALKKDGSIWTWGRNSWGQLGNKSNKDTKIPVQMDGCNTAILKTEPIYFQDEFEIFPNPSSGEINIVLNGLRNGYIDIINTMGQIVYTTSIINEHTSLNLNVGGGVYFIRIREGEKTEIRKIVIVDAKY